MNETRNRGGQRRTGTSRTIQPRDTKRDEKIGNRGEDLIYREEVKRVTVQGYPASRVIWVAKDDPTADHDIRSVDQNGQDLWIEVKSTTGGHGRFEWSPAEFELALRKREHYILWRVYEADSTQPTIKPFCDPISLIIGGSMNIDIAALSAEVEPLEA